MPSVSESQAGSLERGRYRYFPVVPGRVEFAIALRKLLLEQRPQVVALELPDFLGRAYRDAVRRLPEISVILTTADDEERAVYIPVEPADPFTEALRTAEEMGAEVLFLEPDTQERPHLPDTFPDTYSVQRIGLDAYIEAYRVQDRKSTRLNSSH